MRLTLATPGDFDFVSAVCSHGFFVLAPNRWDARRHVLHTVVPDRCGALALALSAGERTLRVTVPGTRARRGHSCERPVTAVRRMLRLDEDLTPFHQKCARSATHREAGRRRFGRLLRSATLFEDVVKVICTCNVTWRQTTAMVEALTRHFGRAAANCAEVRAFPSAARIAVASADELRAVARVGYRATAISRLARGVAAGETDLNALEDPELPTDVLTKRLRELPGIGPYGAAHLCMLLGRYEHLAVDTELRRFWKERYPRRRQTVRAIERHYRRWQPYAFLAYWWELWRGYAETHGAPEGWKYDSQGRTITARRR